MTPARRAAAGPKLESDHGVTLPLASLTSTNTNTCGFTGAGDQVNKNPLLTPLQNNGGPTLTHGILPGSPAIDQGKNFGLATDQRGAPRLFDFLSITNAGGGDSSDIGAVELGRPTLNIQKMAANALLSWPSFYGDFTLQSGTDLSASNSWANVAGAPAVSHTLA